MVPISRRFLFSDRLRFGISAGGVAFAVLLIVLMLALYQGIYDRAGRLASAAPSNLWVTQAGVPDPSHGASILPNSLPDQLERVEGVEAVQPLLARTMQIGTSPNSGSSVFLMALPEGPLQQAAAEAFGVGTLPSSGQIVLSDSISQELSAVEADTVFVGRRPFTVSGVSPLVEGAFSSVAAVNPGDAEELFGQQGSFSYALVTTVPHADAAIVERAIESAAPGVNALTPTEFAAVTRSEIEEEFLPVVAVMVGIAFIVGLAVIALTIYTSTVERSRDYGVLKALGASSGQLFAIVIRQSVAVALVGFAIGLVLGFGGGVFIQELVPEFATLYRWQDLLFVLGAALLMSGIAAFVPIRQVARIDPALVFRA